MILGIDPGLENTGWGVIMPVKSPKSDRDFELVDCGVIVASRTLESPQRLKKIYDEIALLIRNYKPEVLVLEKLFFARNAKSALGVSEAIGVIKIVAANCHLVVQEFTPLQVKMALVGYGQAEKEQVEIMVRELLGLTEVITPSHAADAVAIALTAARTVSYNEL